MKAIILAAGYATRLYPLTENKAKPLLEVGGKSILNHIMEKVESVSEIDQVFIVTNDKFTESFIDWRKTYRGNKPITVINDQTTSNENRLGAIADLQYVIESQQLDDYLTDDEKRNLQVIKDLEEELFHKMADFIMWMVGKNTQTIKFK